MIDVQPKDTRVNHFRISMVKSVFRMLAGMTLIAGQVVVAGVLLIIAEILGVFEEIV